MAPITTFCICFCCSILPATSLSFMAAPAAAVTCPCDGAEPPDDEPPPLIPDAPPGLVSVATRAALVFCVWLLELPPDDELELEPLDELAGAEAVVVDVVDVGELVEFDGAVDCATADVAVTAVVVGLDVNTLLTTGSATTATAVGLVSVPDELTDTVVTGSLVDSVVVVPVVGVDCVFVVVVVGELATAVVVVVGSVVVVVVGVVVVGVDTVGVT